MTPDPKAIFARQAEPSPAAGESPSGTPPEVSQPVFYAAFALQAGNLIAGRYRIIRLIGRGGMGEVYEARDHLLDEPVALKTLRADLACDGAVVKRFQREIQLARKVTHPNVCRVYEAGVHEYADGTPPLFFFTMELLPGEPLSVRVRRRRLTRADAFPIAVQMAQGLQAAHDAGVIHADFKSSNVLLVPSPAGERAVITDFGLARINPTTSTPDDTRTLTRPDAGGRVAGTMAYMSPEQMTGRTITPASDIYSFGIVLYEMATGRLPFDSTDLIHAAMERGSEEEITARPLAPDIDPRWDSAITRCLYKEPRRRFSSARQIGDWFQDNPWRLPHPHWTRGRWIRTGTAAALLAAAVAGLWIWTHRPYRPQSAALDWYDKGIAALHSMTYEAARKALEQAVTADPRFALAHASLARAYDELDYTERAKESMLRAVSASQESRLSTGDATRLRALQFQISNDYDRAAPLLQRIEETAGEREKAAAALESGWLAQKRDKTDDAAAAYERALKAAPGYAAAKLRLGFILGRRGQNELALSTFDQAEELYRAASDYEGITETLYERANLLKNRSRAAEAMPVIEKALSVAKTVGNSYQQIRLQLLEGLVARNLGDAERARELAQQAVDAARAQGMENVATSGLTDLGNSFFSRGEVAPAERYYRQALDFAQRTKARRNEARAQFQLGALFEHSRPADARKFVEAALPFYRQGSYRRELIRAMVVLGGVDLELGQFDDGARTLREALENVVRLHDTQTEALVRERLALILHAQGLWPDALEEHKRQIGLIGSGPASGFARINCAILYRCLGMTAKRDESLAEVRRLLDQKPNAQLKFTLLLEEAQSAYDDGRMKDAAALARTARAAAGPGDPGALARADLCESLALIRLRQGSVPPAAKAITDLEQAHFPFEAAAARLATAQALAAIDDPVPARKLALEALTFFEPRNIWESVWRAQALAARASASPAESEAHRSAARAALARLKAAWPMESMESYRHRSDFTLVSKVIEP